MVAGKTDVDEYDSGHLTIEAAAVIPANYDFEDDRGENGDGDTWVQEAKKGEESVSSDGVGAPQYQKSVMDDENGG